MKEIVEALLVPLLSRREDEFAQLAELLSVVNATVEPRRVVAELCNKPVAKSKSFLFLPKQPDQIRNVLKVEALVSAPLLNEFAGLLTVTAIFSLRNSML